MRHAGLWPHKPRAGCDHAAGRSVRQRCDLVRPKPTDLCPKSPRMGRHRQRPAHARHLPQRGSDHLTAASDEMGDRLRPLLKTHDLIEKKMFGGLGFMLNGNMVIGTTAKGDLLVRIDPAKTEEALQ